MLRWLENTYVKKRIKGGGSKASKGSQHGIWLETHMENAIRRFIMGKMDKDVPSQAEKLLGSQN